MNVPSGQGILAIHDADDTQTLGVPTRITGSVDEDTGVISGATLSTPPLEFDTVAVGLPVEVKATFTQVTPNGGTGLVNGDGKVVLRDAVRVALDLVINGNWIQKCETPPVQLELLSAGTYSQETGGTIVDPDFTVPSVPVTDTCIDPVANGVNDLLAGGGHSLSLFIRGDLPLPDPGEPTTTSLSVSPPAGAIRGTEVALVATVAPAQANASDPTGVVIFKDGPRAVGSADLAPDGTATLTTTALRPGDRSLTAEYQGDSDFAGSTSATVTYNVAPAPILVVGVPAYVTRGGAPVEFDVRIDNVASSRPLAGARVDLVLPPLNAGEMTLEQQLGDGSWETVPFPFDHTLGGLAASIGPFAVPAGEAETIRLRISATSGATVRRVTATLTLVETSGPGGDVTLAATSGPLNIVLASRTASVTEVGVYDPALRPGQQLFVDATVRAGSIQATGEVEFLLDGKVMPFRPAQAFGPLQPQQTRATLAGGYAIGRIDLPADLTHGPHTVTARYLGDASFLPSISEEPYTLQVIDSLSPLYTCDFVSVLAARTGAFVQAFTRLPAHGEDGDQLEVEDLSISLIAGGIDTPAFLSLLATAEAYGTEHIEIDLGVAGTLEGNGVDYEVNWNSADQVLDLRGLQGSIVVDGEPGEVMALPIERIAMTGTELVAGSPFTFTCVPHVDPVTLAEVVVAGVSLDVATEEGPVREGDPVVLAATVGPAAPTGLVEFFSGSISLGTASGASGTATITVDDLPEGANSLSARYSGVPGSPYTSAVVELDVLPAVECAAFAQSGDGATVRLVYLELLGRCPDQAGFDFWTSRLAGGMSSEAFARSIARTPEAVGMVVDDAYRTMLGRRADASGRAFWVDRMRAGSGRYDQLLADLGGSEEFWRLSGSTRAGFVTRVYERLLDRAPDAPGLDYWVARLTPEASRRTLILSLANLDEPLGRLVGLSYDEILGRAPSGTERTDGIAVLRRTGDRSGFYAQLIGQPEFSTRAQEFPNPED